MAMSEEARAALRERNQLRAIQCKRCGATGSTTTQPGAALDPVSHFSELSYRVCGGCGFEDPMVKRGRRARRFQS